MSQPSGAWMPTTRSATSRRTSIAADSILGTGNPATEFLWAGGALADAWPANAADDDYDQVRDSDVETLLIGGTLDFATPARNATRELLPHLPNGRQVVLSELGHTTDFWSYEPKASTRLINTFLASGKVDDSLYTHRDDGLRAGRRADRPRQGHARRRCSASPLWPSSRCC